MKKGAGSCFYCLWREEIIDALLIDRWGSFLLGGGSRLIFHQVRSW